MRPPRVTMAPPTVSVTFVRVSSWYEIELGTTTMGWIDTVDTKSGRIPSGSFRIMPSSNTMTLS